MKTERERASEQECICIRERAHAVCERTGASRKSERGKQKRKRDEDERVIVESCGKWTYRFFVVLATEGSTTRDDPINV